MDSADAKPSSARVWRSGEKAGWALESENRDRMPKISDIKDLEAAFF